MFKHAHAFNQSLDNLFTEQVTDMSEMFSHAINFNGEIGDWNVINVRNMSDMFSHAYAFNQPLRWWWQRGTQVNNMTRMFYNATSFNTPIKLNARLRSKINTTDMFTGASSVTFNQEEIWHMPPITPYT
jgi:hypothetical protein